jgi:hypothetical protein
MGLQLATWCDARAARVYRVMPLMDRIRAFLRSPQGRRVTEQGRRMASDPRNQERLRGLFNRRRR